jgi:lysophospholipid acyltransferase (LPLAT)-like uncharacterized protein
MLKKMGRSAAATAALGWTLTAYLRFTYKTSRFHIVPADIYERVDPHMPIILATWHGQHFLVPFLRRPKDKVAVLVSRHRDGEINAEVLRRLGSGLIRGSGIVPGSGEHWRRFMLKRGAIALREMARALASGTTIVMTADVPKKSRHAGRGIIALAQMSGRPIYPVAAATSRRFELDSWDKAAVNLPFSKGVFVAGDPIFVPADIDKRQAEQYRQKVEDALNAVTERAYAIVDERRGQTA